MLRNSIFKLIPTVCEFNKILYFFIISWEFFWIITYKRPNKSLLFRPYHLHLNFNLNFYFKQGLQLKKYKPLAFILPETVAWLETSRSFKIFFKKRIRLSLLELLIDFNGNRTLALASFAITLMSLLRLVFL